MVQFFISIAVAIGPRPGQEENNGDDGVVVDGTAGEAGKRVRAED